MLELVSAVAEAYFNLLQFDTQLVIAKRAPCNRGRNRSESPRRACARDDVETGCRQFERRANAAARTAELERQMIQAENH